MKIQITPVSVFPHTATQIEFLPAEIALGVSARVQYVLQDSAGQNLTSGWVAMTPEQYANWASNDDYAAACLVENLGLVPLTPLATQLDAAVLDQRGAIATFEADRLQYAAAQAEAAEAKASALVQIDEATLATEKLAAALAEQQRIADALAAAQNTAAEALWAAMPPVQEMRL